MANRIEVVSGIVAVDGWMLFTQRDPKRSSYGYTWESPGGKKEPGETDEEALIRELREELGVETIIETCITSFDLDPPTVERKIHITFYSAKIVSGIPKPIAGIGIGWFCADDILKLTMTPANDRQKYLLAHIANSSRSFCLP